MVISTTFGNEHVLHTMYNASNPAARASLAVKPSKTPGATTSLFGSASSCRRRFAPVSGATAIVTMYSCKVQDQISDWQDVTRIS